MDDYIWGMTESEFVELSELIKAVKEAHQNLSDFWMKIHSKKYLPPEEAEG